jgi:phosphoribosylformimino-5-aminoimidazole carboxamide ribotide isomerase
VASTFDLLPAIDLRGGRVVRLERGDFDRETAFSDDPSAVAAGFVDGGATWLHVVDLDGARQGAPVHGDVIRAMVGSLGPGVRLEIAGGFRSGAAIEEALGLGVRRVVIGTAALADPSMAGAAIAAHGSARLAVAVDVRDGLAIGEGWRDGAPGIRPDEAIRRLVDCGVTTFEVTAIMRDGLLGGPDLALLGGLVDLGRGEIIASGGIARIDDISAVRRLGCVGAIVGRALYDGSLDLGAALAAALEPLEGGLPGGQPR